METSLKLRRSVSWIGSNLGAASLVGAGITRFLAYFILLPLLGVGIASQLLSSIVAIAGGWLGVSIGIRYVQNRSIVPLDKLKPIAFTAATVSVVLTLVVGLMGYLNAVTDQLVYHFPFVLMFNGIAAAIVTFMLVWYQLPKSINGEDVSIATSEEIRIYKGLGVARVIAFCSFIIFGVWGYLGFRDFLSPPVDWSLASLATPLVLVIFLVGSLVYFIFLQIAEKKHKNVSHATFIAICILILGIVLIYAVDYFAYQPSQDEYTPPLNEEGSWTN